MVVALLLLLTTGQTARPPAPPADYRTAGITPDDLKNIGLICQMQSRSKAETSRCLKEQTDKLAKQKQIELDDKTMEALTAKELSTGQTVDH